MSDDKDGGPAFPELYGLSGSSEEGSNGAMYTDLTASGSGGISIRDYFAAKALPAVIGMLTSGNVANVRTKDGSDAITEAHIAEQSYAFADAMLEARKR
jgi:hypothetical protein